MNCRIERICTWVLIASLDVEGGFGTVEPFYRGVLARVGVRMTVTHVLFGVSEKDYAEV